MLPPTDFESVTSTNSIIPADWLTNIIHDGGGIGKPFHAEILLGMCRITIHIGQVKKKDEG